MLTLKAGGGVYIFYILLGKMLPSARPEFFALPANYLAVTDKNALGREA